MIDQDKIKIGENWVAALAGRDYQRLGRLVHPQALSRLMTPRQVDELTSAGDLLDKVQGWFDRAESITLEDSDIQTVGEKLGIRYRFRMQIKGVETEAEQQIFARLEGETIERLDLLCTGFLPVAKPSTHHCTPAGPMETSSPRQTTADALLVVDSAAETQAPSCATLTPTIKARLRELASGQILEVRADGPSAPSVRGDIEAWCRLSGNELVRINELGPQQVHFFIQKK